MYSFCISFVLVCDLVYQDAKRCLKGCITSSYYLLTYIQKMNFLYTIYIYSSKFQSTHLLFLLFLLASLSVIAVAAPVTVDLYKTASHLLDIY